MPEKQILLAVLGVTPQIVTETLHCLTIQKGISIDAVYVVTTVDGRNALMGIPQERYPISLETAIGNLCERHSIQQPYFNPRENVFVAEEETVQLHDIRSDRENRLFPNMVADVVKRLSAQPDVVLHCSVAGGRKSMSVALAAALSIFGRRGDRLYHVLASHQMMESQAFFPASGRESELVLAEIPYVRLRGLLDLESLSKGRSFLDIVDFAQRSLDDLIAGPRLKIDIEKRRLYIGSSQIDLQPKELAVYLHYLIQGMAVPGGKGYSKQQADDLIRIYRKVAVAEGHKEKADKSLRDWPSVNKAITGINKKLVELLDAGAEELKIERNKKYGANTYFIRLDRRRVQDYDKLKRMF